MRREKALVLSGREIPPEFEFLDPSSASLKAVSISHGRLAIRASKFGLEADMLF